LLRFKRILMVSLCFFCFACLELGQNIEERLLNSSDMNEVQFYAGMARKLGLDGIPIFLRVISHSIKNPARFIDYGKVNLCIFYLNEMAKEGRYSKESVPVLFIALKHQLYMPDTLVTAETIELITGKDIGYNHDFVTSYTDSDEPKRKEMISKWKIMAGVPGATECR